MPDATGRPLGLERGDSVYIRHPSLGPMAVKVLAAGRDGLTGEAANGERHTAAYADLLGHKERVGAAYQVIDEGADGAIVQGADGRRRYVDHGGKIGRPAEIAGKPPARKPDDPLLDGMDRLHKAETIMALIPPGARVVFLPADVDDLLKAGGIANRAGLALKEITDKSGRHSKHWVRTMKPQAAARRPGAAEDGPAPGKAPMQHGDVVRFRHGDVEGKGRIVGSGTDGVTVHDGQREHQVRHEHLIGKAPEHEQAGAITPPVEAGDHVNADGTIPPDKFSAGDFAAQHNDPNVTPADILKAFPPDTEAKIAAVNKKLEAATQTIDTFKKDGVYTPERQKLHDTIIAKYFTPETVAGARPADGEAPTFTILGGRGGSGKSWFDGQVYNEHKAIVLDADAIKQMLPEYEGWNAAVVHEESGDLFDKITQIAKDEGLNIVHDATMKTAKKAVALVQGFKDAGYQTEAHYMYLPPQEAAKRAVSRFLGPTKRFVPPGIVLGNTTNEGSFDQVKGLVDKWSFRDNNVSKGQPPKLISENNGEAGPGQSGRDGLPAAGTGDGGGNPQGAGSDFGGRPQAQGTPLAKALAEAGHRVVFFKAAPSQAQLEAGNYEKPKRVFQGLPISVENPRGSTRSGTSKSGKTWSTKMQHDYGYIRGTLGSDGDHYDCYVGPHEDATHAHIVNTMQPPDFTKPDEQKAMLGFNSPDEAKDAFLAHYDKPGFFGSMTSMPMDEFKSKVMRTRDDGHPGLLKGIWAFFKAAIRGHERHDLFALPTHVAGYERGKARVKGYTAIRHRHLEPHEKAHATSAVAAAAAEVPKPRMIVMRKEAAEQPFRPGVGDTVEFLSDRQTEKGPAPGR